MNCLSNPKTPLGDVRYDNRHGNRNKSRVDAIISNCPVGDNALDIGCNAGYFSRGLLDCERVSRVQAIEYDSNIVPLSLKNDERFSLFAGDATNFVFKEDYDFVVYGAVHHHIFANHGYAAAMEFWCKVIAHTNSVVFMESGQLAEGSRWYWQREMSKYYSTDEMYFADLAYAVGPRLQRISVIGRHWIHGVRRWLLKFELLPRTLTFAVDLPTVNDITVEKKLRRVIDSTSEKTLVDDTVRGSAVHEGPLFTVGLIPGGERVFCKQRVSKAQIRFESAVGAQITDKRFITPVGYSEEHGLVFPFCDKQVLGSLERNSVIHKRQFKESILSLYRFAKSTTIRLEFAGGKDLRLIDCVDLHPGNMFLDEENNKVLVFDLEAYSLQNASRNELGLMRVLIRFGPRSLNTYARLTKAYCYRAFSLFKFALSSPEQRIVSRTESVVAWSYVRVRDIVDRIIARIVPSYWE